ncbi:MAG TPA: class I SAM-dependent methyltransferase [Anaerolineales bacterium]|nr:class I SAM-dependent methyltransferase [Anaerolineales bacterium]
MNWIIGITIGVIVGYLLDREIYFYEGAHLGPRAQAWLYDRWSRKYDAGKRESQLRDDEMLARPLLDTLKDTPEPFILDFATGTGRLSFALLNQADFTGRIVALDLSQGMLEQASEKLSRAERRDDDSPSRRRSASVELIRHLALPLPFPDSTFDVVCALEVLELFPSMDESLKELTRVLRPGGILLTTRGTEESGRRAKVKSKPVFTSLLEANGLREIQITPWWKLFDRVLARKNGESSPVVGAKNLSEVLRCGVCGQVEWERARAEPGRSKASALTCRSCGKSLSVTTTGIVLN